MDYEIWIQRSEPNQPKKVVLNRTQKEFDKKKKNRTQKDKISKRIFDY